MPRTSLIKMHGNAVRTVIIGKSILEILSNYDRCFKCTVINNGKIKLSCNLISTDVVGKNNKNHTRSKFANRKCKTRCLNIRRHVIVYRCFISGNETIFE